MKHCKNTEYERGQRKSSMAIRKRERENYRHSRKTGWGYKGPSDRRYREPNAGKKGSYTATVNVLSGGKRTAC
jgi:hypothetical protein